MDNLNREFFPGYADPDGRPWLWSRSRKGYGAMLEFNLKLGLLTQRRMVVPRGYIFDNPELQKLIANRGGKDKESEFFLKCIEDFFAIATDETEGQKLDSQDSWNYQFLLWIGGKEGAQSRNINAYPNVIKQRENIENLSAIADASAYHEKFIQLNRIENKIDLLGIFDTLSKCKLKTIKPTYDFDFEYRVKDQLIENPKYEISKPIREKLQIIAENNKGRRLSRSLLQNEAQVKQIAGDKNVISPEEYRTNLMKPLRHYHHLSFANSFGSDCILSELQLKSGNYFVDASRNISNEIKDKKFSISGSLERLPYEKLFSLRNSYKFRESLSSLENVSAIHEDEYFKLIKNHWKICISVMQEKSISLITLNIPKILENSASDPDSTSTGNAINTIKTILSLGANVYHDAFLEVHMRQYWRKLQGARNQYLINNK